MKLAEIHSHYIVEADEPGAPDLNGKGPIEVSDVLKYFPKNYQKVLRVLWGKPRLSFKGKPFFDEVYNDIDDALEQAKKDGYEVEMSIPVEGTDELDMDELNYQAEVADTQEVYLGYSPSEDCLYVGVDVWLQEESFNEAWDREFENATGEEFDMDNEEHAKVFNSAWKEYRDNGFVGALFKLEGDGPFDAQEEITMPGGFYRGVRPSPTFKALKLVDLRLD